MCIRDRNGLHGPEWCGLHGHVRSALTVEPRACYKGPANSMRSSPGPCCTGACCCEGPAAAPWNCISTGGPCIAFSVGSSDPKVTWPKLGSKDLSSYSVSPVLLSSPLLLSSTNSSQKSQKLDVKGTPASRIQTRLSLSLSSTKHSKQPVHRRCNRAHHKAN